MGFSLCSYLQQLRYGEGLAPFGNACGWVGRRRRTLKAQMRLLFLQRHLLLGELNILCHLLV